MPRTGIKSIINYLLLIIIYYLFVFVTLEVTRFYGAWQSVEPIGSKIPVVWLSPACAAISPYS